jgi:bifunctional UDP-N-acetylglucosamine pyrophosphorylase/glucosamine-1-phosphate N-acetyltransferase
MNSHVIILAGGRGTRMRSPLPKALTPLAGRSFLEWILPQVLEIDQRPSIVVGDKGEEIIKATNNLYHYIFQAETLGTGHALRVAKESLEKESYENIIVLAGDLPFIKATTLKRLIARHTESQAATSLVTARVPNFDGIFENFYHYGRVVRDDTGRLDQIVEFKDATEAQREIKELTISQHCFKPEWLWSNLSNLTPSPTTGEYYLTQLVDIACQNEEIVETIETSDPIEGLGVNTPEELERISGVVQDLLI